MKPTTELAKAQEHHKQGRIPQAEAGYRKVIAQDPRSARARSYLGYLLYQTKREAEALAMLDESLARDARVAETHAWRGLVLSRLGRLEDAVEANTKAVALDPRHAGAHNNLGGLLVQLRRHEQGITHLRRAFELGYKMPGSLVLLGQACIRTGRLVEAEAAFRDALALDPKHVDARIGLGNVLYDLGDHEAGLAALRVAMAADPGALGARSNFVMKLLYHHDEGGHDEGGHEDGRETGAPKLSPQAVAAEHEAAGQAYFARFGGGGPVWRPRDRDPDRRLRVGYLSPDFRLHATAFFLDAVLASHDPAVVEVCCYSNADKTDEMTEHLRGLVHGFHDISRLGHREAAAKIAADGIDVLVDCAGHTSGHRLDVLACKPAPLQGTWLGYPHGTGLPTMDFRLTDAIADPPGMTEDHYVERLVRLPEGTFCYRAPATAPAPAPGPLERGQGPVFGCFNNPQKIGAEVIALWASIVRAVPGAKLRLKARQFLDAKAAQRTRERFVAAGLPADRLEIEGRRTFAEGFAEYSTIDVALDPFPYHGTTSTCEALWMATPVVTLPGTSCVSRVGASLLERVGLSELVARDPAHYRELAIRLVRDPPRLATLRRTLRDRMASSSLCDGPRFARQLEAAYRELWREFCGVEPRPAGASSTAITLDPTVATPSSPKGTFVEIVLW